MREINHPTPDHIGLVTRCRGQTQKKVNNSKPLTRSMSHSSRVDFIILPILMLGLFALQLDKGNVAYALTISFTDDLGIDKNKVNYGNQLMLAAIFIFEIPFNLILSRVGPAKWLTIQIFAWGTIATAQTAIHNLSGFYATRFMLGMWEAGYLAASLTILASFYTRKRNGYEGNACLHWQLLRGGDGRFDCGGNFSHSAIDWIEVMAGEMLDLLINRWYVDSSFPRQWWFLINGLFTLVVGVFFIFFMPRSTENTVPLCGLKQLDFFTEEERHIMNNRVVLDDPRKVVGLSGILLVGEAFSIDYTCL